MKIKLLIDAFTTSPPYQPSDAVAQKKRLTRELVSRYSQGSPSLQRGRYVSKADADARVKKIFGYRFSK